MVGLIILSVFYLPLLMFTGFIQVPAPCSSPSMIGAYTEQKICELSYVRCMCLLLQMFCLSGWRQCCSHCMRISACSLDLQQLQEFEANVVILRGIQLSAIALAAHAHARRTPDLCME